MLGLLILCSCIAVDAKEAASWPADELQITCSDGCDGDSAKSPRFYVDANIPAVVLIGTIPGGGKGDWFVNGVYSGSTDSGNRIMVVAGNEKHVKFIANGREKSVTLVYKSVKCDLKLGSKISITSHGDKDKDKDSFSPGETFTVDIDVEETDCGYELLWSTDREDILSIDDPHSVNPEITVEKTPDFDPNPKITVTLYDSAGDTVDKEELTVRVEESEPPQLELSVNGGYGSIIVSCAGSKTSGEDNEIDDFYVNLRYYGDFGWESVSDQRYGSKKVTLDASRGDGLYKVIAYITDSHGNPSQTVENTVEVWPEVGEAPNVHVANDTVYCVVGEPCHIDAWQTYRNSKKYNLSIDIGYYDEHDNLVASGPECDIIFDNPGDYKVIVRASLIGKNGIDDRKEREVMVKVARKK